MAAGLVVLDRMAAVGGVADFPRIGPSCGVGHRNAVGQTAPGCCEAYDRTVRDHVQPGADIFRAARRSAEQSDLRRGASSGPNFTALAEDLTMSNVTAGANRGRRPTGDQYFMTITRQVAERSPCQRAKVGAVIVRDRNILATGYNGAPAGLPHCTDVGCLIYTSQTPTGEIEENCFRTIHAEINAIAQAAKNGVSIRGADIYITHTPCIHCLKVLINTGIRRVFYEREYKLHTLSELLRWSDVRLERVVL